jgi:hypothetical protein
MVNKMELAICKRRGHESMGLSDGWKQCKWRGIWLRRDPYDRGEMRDSRRMADLFDENNPNVAPRLPTPMAI